MQVPFRIPVILLTFDPDKPSLKDFIMGMHPATDASKASEQSFFSLNLAKSYPCFDIIALLAVTTDFPFINEFLHNSNGTPSEPPISSTTKSTSLNEAISVASSNQFNFD